VAHPVLGSPPGGSQDAAGRSLTRVQQLDLYRQLGTSVWLARADGEPVSARLATAAAFDPETQNLDAALVQTAAMASLHSPHLVPVLGVANRGEGTWLVSQYVEGVSLSRLLCAAALTPVQAGYIALRLFQAVAWLHENAVAHGRLTAANVLVGVDGEPRLSDWALVSLAHLRGFEETATKDLADARRLVAELAHDANRPVMRHRGRYDGLIEGLEQVGRGVDGWDATASASHLEQVLTAAVGETTGLAGPRAEIGALVIALARRRSPQDASDRTPRPTPVPVPVLLPSGRLSEADWHRARRRPWLRAGVAVLVVAALAAGGYVFAKGPAGELVDWVLDRGGAQNADPLPRTDQAHPSPSPSTGDGVSSGLPTPHPVPELAPPRAGAVTAVSLRALAACSPGSTCLLRLTTRITPATTSREVAMQVSVANRCTGAVRTGPAVTVTAHPGWTYVFVTTSVRLPRVGSLAAVAVTTAPARAASPPLLVPATGGSC
jgi:tRNA A-37 threonylcarbamoyl transferase component Bud32